MMTGIRTYIWLSLAVLVGFAGGYLYWHFYACEHGCSITSSWWRSVLVGGLFGYLGFGILFDKEKKENKQDQN